MTRDLDSLPERLLASVIGLDELVERDLLACELLDAPTPRLRAVKSLLAAAFAGESFPGSYGEAFESPAVLEAIASDVNLAYVEATQRNAPGWEEWLLWYQRYEDSLAYFVLDLVTGTPTSLRERFEMFGRVPARSRGGLG